MPGSKIVLSDGADDSIVDTILEYDTAYRNANLGCHTPITITKVVDKDDYKDAVNPSIRWCFPAMNYQQASFSMGTHEVYFTCKFYDINILMQTEIDNSDEGDIERDIQEIDKVYIGVNGTKQSWNASVPAIKPHEIHRDLLWRECGITDTPQGWTDVVVQRALFKSHYWLSEETDFEKELEKLQFEGAFIYRYNSQGQLTYLVLKQSYTAGDVKATIDPDDISDIKSSTTQISSLINTIKFNYLKNPATGRLSEEYTQFNPESREYFNMTNFEKVYQKNLDCLVDYTAVTALANHINLVAGRIRILVDITIINPSLYGLEIGDIVQLSSLEEHIVGQYASLNTYYFMVVKINRTLNKGVKMKLREIYQS